MTALARALVRRRVPILNLLFHSSEVIAGGSPYNRTEKDVVAFYDRLGQFFKAAIDELDAVPMTFREFSNRFGATTAVVDRMAV